LVHCMYQEKSGNPGLHRGRQVPRTVPK
jgi:hypothetical protein